MKWSFLVLAILLVTVPAAMADTFILQNYSVSLNTGDPGLVVNYTNDVSSLPYSFGLNVGQSATFSLFDIYTPESSVNVGEDTVAKPISVTLNFSQPSSSGTVGGSTAGVSELFGFIQYGKVTWGGPTTVAFGSTGLYTISLSNATFNEGIGGLGCLSDDVFATIKYTRGDTAPVPEPGSLILLGSGLLGGAGWLRRKLGR